MEELLVVISCFVNIILWLFFFFYFKKKFSSQQILENIRQEVDKLLIEISRETDRDLSLVEDKMKALTELIEKADEHIRIAKKEQKKQKKEEETLKKIKEMSNPQELSIQKPVYSMESAVSRYINTNPSVVGHEKPPEVDAKKTEKPVREKVIELWNLGLDPERIAEKLSVSLTEIRMIIDMYG